MFHSYNKIVQPSKEQLANLIRIIPAAQLITEGKRGTLITEIKQLCFLDEKRFETLGQNLINNWLNQCQNLPEASYSYYTYRGGLIDHGLQRALIALELLQPHIRIKDNKLSEEQQLWVYALFSAAILQGVGKLFLDYAITTYSNQAMPLKTWNPLVENLTDIGNYYSYKLEKEADIELRRKINLLLAKQLLPANGFAWIAGNLEVLTTWLALINEDFYAAGTLGTILIRAEAIAIANYFHNLSDKNTISPERPSFIQNSTFPLTPSQPPGLAFINWLNKSLASGHLILNKEPLYVVPGGLLLSPELFKLFTLEHQKYKNWQSVQKDFLALGLHQKHPNKDIISFERGRKTISGIVFSSYAIALPTKISWHNLQTKETLTSSATDLINQLPYIHFMSKHSSKNLPTLTFLNETGTWDSAPSSINLTNNNQLKNG